MAAKRNRRPESPFRAADGDGARAPDRVAGTSGQNGEMAPDLAELSSITSSLDQITRRVAAIAEQANESGDETVSAELFSVERALQGATRRLGRLLGGA
jgi:hypothetical protein